MDRSTKGGVVKLHFVIARELLYKDQIKSNCYRVGIEGCKALLSAAVFKWGDEALKHLPRCPANSPCPGGCMADPLLTSSLLANTCAATEQAAMRCSPRSLQTGLSPSPF